MMTSQTQSSYNDYCSTAQLSTFYTCEPVFKNVSDLQKEINPYTGKPQFILYGYQTEPFEKSNRAKYVTACGVLFTKGNGNTRKFLLSRSHWCEINKIVAEDIGGKVDMIDKTVYDTVIREVHEETNKVICLSHDRLQSTRKYYIEKLKYLLFIVDSTQYEASLSIDDFGLFEFPTNNQPMHSRMIEWLSFNECNDFKLSARIDGVINEILGNDTEYMSQLLPIVIDESYW